MVFDIIGWAIAGAIGFFFGATIWGWLKSYFAKANKML